MSDFSKIYAEASAAGRAAAAACSPVPIVVGSETSLFSGKLDPSKPVYVVNDGACGFAWVNVRPRNSAFAKWLKKEGIARPDSYEGGVKIWISEYNQSLARKEAHAAAMAKKLRELGIERAYSGSRMD